MTQRNLLLTLLLVLALPAAACRQAEPVREVEHGEAHDEHGTHSVHLTAEQMKAFDVAVATAGPGTVDLGVDLPCEVRPNGDRLAHIVPRFPGIVKEVRKTIGDTVRTGDVLAVIESSESLAPYQLT